MLSELVSANPFNEGSNCAVNSLNVESVSPRRRSGCFAFNKILRIACVAHALLITFKYTFMTIMKRNIQNPTRINQNFLTLVSTEW